MSWDGWFLNIQASSATAQVWYFRKTGRKMRDRTADCCVVRGRTRPVGVGGFVGRLMRMDASVKMLGECRMHCSLGWRVPQLLKFVADQQGIS